MNKNNYKLDMRSTSFLVNDRLKIHELEKFEQFSDFDQLFLDKKLHEAVEFIEKNLADLNQDQECILKDGKVIAPTGFKKAWELIFQQDWSNFKASDAYEFRRLPELLVTVVKEALLGTNASFAQYFINTLEVHKLLETLASDQLEEYLKKLSTGKASATFAFTEKNADFDLGAVQTSAKKEEDYYLIEGTKSYINCGDHNLTDNILYLVLARAEAAPKGEKGLSLFLVPKFRLENGELQENGVSVKALGQRMGMKGASSCELSFSEDCRGYLVGKLHEALPILQKAISNNGFNSSILALAQAEKALGKAINFTAAKKQGTAIEAKKAENYPQVKLNTHPLVIDDLNYMQALVDGLKGAVYSTAHNQDLAACGNKIQKTHFQELVDLYLPILKAYATEESLTVVDLAIQLHGLSGYSAEAGLEQAYRDLRIAPVQDGNSSSQAIDLLFKKLEINDGELFQQLMVEFEKINPQASKTETMRDAIGFWRDYIGGLFVAVDELRSLKNGKDARVKALHAGKLLKLFGDVIVSYHLISQALLAEHMLAEEEIEYSKVKEEAKKSDKVRFLYNKLVTAEYFALNVLPRQEGNIQMIKRRSGSALEAIFN